jgi:hypothetical protein
MASVEARVWRTRRTYQNGLNALNPRLLSSTHVPAHRARAVLLRQKSICDDRSHHARENQQCRKGTFGSLASSNCAGVRGCGSGAAPTPPISL